MAQKPSIPKGTRDFGPEVVEKRQFIINTIKNAFQHFGFAPIETPSFENIETLTGKYGDEGDQLIFKILKSGDFTNKLTDKDWAEKSHTTLANKIVDKALRYDLTVPFARFVVQHQNELAFPFKRYQIQPVWRADRPQRGRFREFYQCDADVVGSDSLWQEVEFVQLYDEVFTKLGLSITIKMSNRKILAGIAESLDIEDKFIGFTVALDKLDKIGVDGVLAELEKNEFSKSSISAIASLLNASNSEESLAQLEMLLKNSKTGQKGIEELKFVQEKCESVGLKSAHLVFDLTLARGLNYYTGAIFEVVANDINLGSIGGGGRYDDLTGVFGLNNMSGIGISFGLDRIYLCMDELHIFPENSLPKVQALFLNFGESESEKALQLIRKLRDGGISSELYPDNVKLKKQFDYASKKGIKNVVFLGDKEVLEKSVSVKNIQTGVQVSVPFEDLICYFLES